MSHSALQTDKVICHCLQVTESTIQDCVTLLGATTVCEVKQACGAGGGCMSCRSRIRNLINSRDSSASRLANS